MVESGTPPHERAKLANSEFKIANSDLKLVLPHCGGLDLKSKNSVEHICVLLAEIKLIRSGLVL